MRNWFLINLCLNLKKRDPYWSQLISRHFKYEHELEYWFRSQVSNNFFFIDCGANIGYWSIFVSKVLGVKSFLAVEPNPKVFKMLLHNFKLNNLSGSAIQAAVGGNDDEENSWIDFFIDSSPGNHAGASIFQENTNFTEVFQVPLVKFSKLFEPVISTQQRIVLKLDVEGAEIQCFKQIPTTLRSRVEIIFEDHGRDQDCLATQWLLSTHAYKIYFLNRHGSIPIDRLETLKRLKKSKKKGYNLVAIPI